MDARRRRTAGFPLAAPPSPFWQVYTALALDGEQRGCVALTARGPP